MGDTQSPTMAMLKTGGQKDAAGGDAATGGTVAEGAATAETVKPKKKTGKAAKAAAKSKDPISFISHEVENLTKDKALEEAHELVGGRREGAFRLGGVFQRIQQEGWYADTHEDFWAWVSDVHGLKKRTALQYVSVYNGLLNSGVAWDDVKVLGWTKVYELVDVITPDNVKQWVEKAKGMTVIQLRDAVKAVQSPGADPAPGGKSDLTTLTFKVHEDQKENIKAALAKAQKEYATEYPAVALDNLCTNYMSGQLGKPSGKVPSLKELMQKSTPEAVLVVFEECWPDFEVTVSVPAK